MTIHTPAHPSGVVSPQVHHHYFAWLAIAAAIVLAIGAVLLVPAGTFRLTSSTNDEQKSLVEYRAYERADWAAGTTSESDSLIQFRASERAGD